MQLQGPHGIWPHGREPSHGHGDIFRAGPILRWLSGQGVPCWWPGTCQQQPLPTCLEATGWGSWRPAVPSVGRTRGKWVWHAQCLVQVGGCPWDNGTHVELVKEWPQDTANRVSVNSWA